MPTLEDSSARITFGMIGSDCWRCGVQILLWRSWPELGWRPPTLCADCTAEAFPR